MKKILKNLIKKLKKNSKLFIIFTLIKTFIFLAVFSCRKIDENGFKTYTIKEGKHRSAFKYKTTCDTSFSIVCIFDSSAIYSTEDPLNQLDVNKLYGLSDCGSNHMDNSIRFGWRWVNDSLEILWFKHQLGVFTFEKITTVNLCETIPMTLHITNNNYVLCVDGTCDSTERLCSMEHKRYFLYPYFGGNETAPHRITIKIKE